MPKYRVEIEVLVTALYTVDADDVRGALSATYDTEPEYDWRDEGKVLSVKEVGV
jgi:hypothetical protein